MIGAVEMLLDTDPDLNAQVKVGGGKQKQRQKSFIKSRIH
jgi:hypothetical protein